MSGVEAILLDQIYGFAQVLVPTPSLCVPLDMAGKSMGLTPLATNPPRESHPLAIGCLSTECQLNKRDGVNELMQQVSGLPWYHIPGWRKPWVAKVAAAPPIFLSALHWLKGVDFAGASFQQVCQVGLLAVVVGLAQSRFPGWHLGETWKAVLSMISECPSKPSPPRHSPQSVSLPSPMAMRPDAAPSSTRPSPLALRPFVHGSPHPSPLPEPLGGAHAARMRKVPVQSADVNKELLSVNEMDVDEPTCPSTPPPDPTVLTSLVGPSATARQITTGEVDPLSISTLTTLPVPRINGVPEHELVSLAVLNVPPSSLGSGLPYPEAPSVEADNGISKFKNRSVGEAQPVTAQNNAVFRKLAPGQPVPGPSTEGDNTKAAKLPADPAPKTGGGSKPAELPAVPAPKPSARRKAQPLPSTRVTRSRNPGQMAAPAADESPPDIAADPANLPVPADLVAVTRRGKQKAAELGDALPPVAGPSNHKASDMHTAGDDGAVDASETGEGSSTGKKK
ncbi:hypothetical protein FRB90_004233, partial [Tulasnella sp. 427]